MSGASPGSVPAGVPRPRRSLVQSLLSIVLALDAMLVFFVMLTAYGLHVLPDWVVFTSGVGLIVVLVGTGRVISKPWGIWLGHALQVVLIALGFVLLPMFFVGAIFAALWVYCFFVGRRLDRRNDAILNSTPPPTTP